SLGAAPSEPGGSGKKTILIAAAVLLVAAALGYVGWTRLHTVAGAPAAQALTPPTQAAPVRVPSTVSGAVSPAAGSPQEAASAHTPSQPNSAAALPAQQGP